MATVNRADGGAVHVSNSILWALVALAREWPENDSVLDAELCAYPHVGGVSLSLLEPEIRDRVERALVFGCDRALAGERPEASDGDNAGDRVMLGAEWVRGFLLSKPADEDSIRGLLPPSGMNVDRFRHLLAMLEIPESTVSFDGPREESFVCYSDPHRQRWVVGRQKQGSADRDDCLTENEAVSWMLDNFTRLFDDGYFGGAARTFEWADQASIALPVGSVVGVSHPDNKMVPAVDVPGCEPALHGRDDVLCVVDRQGLRGVKHRTSWWYSRTTGSVLVLDTPPGKALQNGTLREVWL